MTKISKSLVLAAPPQQVWKFIIDPKHFSDYVPGYRAGAEDHSGTLAVGSEFSWKAKLGPLELLSTERVTSLEPNDSVVFEGTLGGISFRSAMRLRAVGSGSQLWVDIEYDAPAHSVGQIADALVGSKVVELYVGDSLDRIRDWFEPAPDRPAGSAAFRENEIRGTYSFWGRTGLYDLGTAFTMMFRDRPIRARVVEGLQLEAGARVLDVCCGTGLNLPHLVRAVGSGGQVVGLDYTRAMLDRAEQRCRSKGWDNVELVQGDACRLVYSDGGFDGVLCVLGMSVVPDFSAALRHLVRVCRPGARVVVSDGHPFRGPYQPLNTVMLPAYRRIACWDRRKDIIEQLRPLLKDFDLQWHNGGTLFVASGLAAGE